MIYDEENRLTSISDLNVSGQPNTKYEFVYDGMSRLRISRYYARNGSGALTLQNETRRVYDGMDVVQERDAGNNVTASYTRTGNIGGILARTTSAGSVFYGYDGGGNVTTLTNNAGAQVGSYTYDAWGNTVATSGGTANENPYRFSTKESFGGLYSYGLRFYSPGLGRWINRDPIGEAGGVNLYMFAGNDPVNSGDEYGLIDVKKMINDWLFGSSAKSCDEDEDPAWALAKYKAGNDQHSIKRTAQITEHAYNGFYNELPQQMMMGGVGKGIAKGVASFRRPWAMSKAATSAVRLHPNPKFGKFYQHASTGLWWSLDKAGHGKAAPPVWKVFRQEGNKLKWIADADKYGDFIVGKHKGPVGLIIPMKELGKAGF